MGGGVYLSTEYESEQQKTLSGVFGRLNLILINLVGFLSAPPLWILLANIILLFSICNCDNNSSSSHSNNSSEKILPQLVERGLPVFAKFSLR